MNPANTSATKKIVVIGGGIAGMTAAYRLAGEGHQVVLLEQSEQLGGLAAAFPVPGGHLEFFYHHLFLSDEAIISLIDELGISDSLAWLDSQNSYFSNGDVYSLASPMDLLKLPVVPFLDRVRIGLVTLYLQRITTASGRWKKFERVTAWEWLRRAVGKRAFDTTFGGQLRAKFGPRAEEVAMVWFWNKIYLRTQSRPGLLGKEQLGYILGSFNVLIDRLAEACRERGVEICSDAGAGAVRQLTQDPPAFTVTDTAGRCHDADAIVVTTPAPVLGKLFSDIEEPYRSKLRSTVYQGAVCMLLRLNRPLTDTYWLNIVDERLPFTVIVEHTNFIGPEHYDGNHYVYVNKYLDWDHRYATMPEDEVIEEYFSYLPLLNSDFDRAWVEDVWLFRTPTAQPVVGLFYPERIPEHRTPIAGVYLASMSQIYPEDRGTNYAVDLGNRVAKMVAEDLGARRSVANQPG